MNFIKTTLEKTGFFALGMLGLAITVFMYSLPIIFIVEVYLYLRG
jgi:hypothetical protein